MYNSKKTRSGRNTPSPVPLLSIDDILFEDTREPLLRRGFVEGSGSIPSLPIGGITREDSPAPLLGRGPAEESSSTSISVQGFVPSPAIMDMPGVISVERATRVQDTQAPSDADGAAFEGDDATQDDLSTDPFDNSSADNEQDSFLTQEPAGGTSSSTTSGEPSSVPVEASMSVTAFMQACMRVIEDANVALDDPGSELSAIFPPGIEARRTFLKTALSLVSNWRAYKNVSQRGVFFELEFDIKNEPLIEYIDAFNKALYARETGKYGLVRSAYLVKIITFLMGISKDRYERSLAEQDSEEKQADMKKQADEIWNELIDVVKLFSMASQNPAYRDDTLPELFSKYLDEAEMIVFQHYLAQMAEADKQIEAALVICKDMPYRHAGLSSKQAVLDAFKAKLYPAFDVTEFFEFAVVLDHKLMIINDPTSALAIGRYQNYWTALNLWGKKLKRDLDNQEERLGSLIKLIKATARSSNKIYITAPCLQQIQAARRQEVLAQTFDEALFLQTNNESGQFIPAFLDPKQLNPLDFEGYLGPLDSSITDFKGNALLPSQVFDLHREAKKGPVATTQSMYSSNSDHSYTSGSSSGSYSHTSGSGFFGGLLRRGKKPRSTVATPSSLYVGSNMLTTTSSSSNMPKPPSGDSAFPADNGTEKRTVNPVFRKPLARS